MKTLKQIKKSFWVIDELLLERLLMMLSLSVAYAKRFLWIFLGIKRAATKIVPKLLNFELKQHRMDRRL